MPLPNNCLQLAFLFAATLLFADCFDLGRKPYKEEIFPEAYIPVYGIDSARRIISSDIPQPTTNAGKIYVHGNLLYQVEVFKGIHIIDYSNKDQPVKLAFLHIPGCSEVTVKNNILLTNNRNDLGSLDIGHLPVVAELSRVSNTFAAGNFYNADAINAKPPILGVHYVCPDAYSGDILGWTLGKDVTGAYCVTN